MRVVDRPARRRRARRGSGRRRPLDVVGGEQGREALVGGVGLGRDHDAGGVLVQPVDDARPRHAADAGEAGAAVVDQGVDQGARQACPAPGGPTCRRACRSRSDGRPRRARTRARSSRLRLGGRRRRARPAGRRRAGPCAEASVTTSPSRLTAPSRHQRLDAGRGRSGSGDRPAPGRAARRPRSADDAAPRVRHDGVFIRAAPPGRRPRSRGRSRSGSRRGRRRRRPAGRTFSHTASWSQSMRSLDHGLHLAAGLALLPQRLARAAEVVGLAGLQGQPQGLGVHPGQHQHLARLRMGGDRRDQAGGVEPGLKPCSPFQSQRVSRLMAGGFLRRAPATI